MIKFPELTADDIEVRVSRVNQNGVELLLYKNARCDMRILDETVGPENWQRTHEVIDKVLYCSVGIRTEHGDWVWKQDCGTAGNFEAEKGAASDAFKRACFNWGIGRELYTAPEIFIWCSDDPNERICNVKQYGDSWKCYDRFTVRKCIIEDHRIKALWVWNESTGRTAFVLNPPAEEENNEH